MAVPLPSPTLYISNLESKTKKPELRAQLYSLFTPYGKVIDVIAKKAGGGRGQAFVVFEEQAAATAAMRGLSGEPFYDKDLRITYAKTPSYATLARTDPSKSRDAAKIAAARLAVSNAQGEYEQLEKDREAGEAGKRTLEDGDAQGGAPAAKRAKPSGEDEDDMEIEMEMEDDEDAAPSASTSTGTQIACSNLPPEASPEIMEALFGQYPGFQSASSLASSSVPPSISRQNPGAKAFMITFDTPAHTQAALEANKGYLMQPGWTMGVCVV